MSASSQEHDWHQERQLLEARLAALVAFYRDLMEMYGYYVQVTAAIGKFNEWAIRQLSGSTTRSHSMLFGRGDPNLPEARFQAVRTFGELIDSSVSDGPLEVTHRRSVIVFVVASWEDSYRARIAKELGLAKNDLKSDVFYDLNKYRQAILHAGGTLRTEPRALRLFRKGDQVALTEEHMHQVFRTLVDELNRISREFYDIDAQFMFDTPLSS